MTGTLTEKSALIILLFCGAAFGRAIDSGKYGGAFLESGIGCRSMGMGGASAASARDVTAIYWNPAGLTASKGLELHAMHAERFAGIVNFDFIGAATSLKNGLAIGIGLIRLGVDDIPVTRLHNPDLQLGEIYIDDKGRKVINYPYIKKRINDTENALFLSFARRYGSRISLGGSVKIIHKNVSPYQAWGIGFDIGATAALTSTLEAGIILRECTSTLIAWKGGTREQILPNAQAGLLYKLNVGSFRIIPECDLVVHLDNRAGEGFLRWRGVTLGVRGGVEVAYREKVFLRCGSRDGRFTAGAGIRIDKYGVDYGFSTHAALGNSHHVSVTFHL